jgi:purine-nucleoside/S-methyl-5'-thioadenosine phosphorylase / adenosine deaminase
VPHSSVLRLPPEVVLLGDGPTRRLQTRLLTAVPGLTHAFTVKGSDAQAVLGETMGAHGGLRSLRQVHGANVRIVEPDASSPRLEGDALATREPHIPLAVWVADCPPILVCDPKSRALAAVHAGWRGTVAGILRAAIETLRQSFGARPADLLVAIGPSIGPCCFEVGDEVVEALLRADGGAATCVISGPRKRIDLIEANRRQALMSGVPAAQIRAAGLCTVCRTDLLPSYRRDREAAGRMAGIIAWGA